MFKNPYVPFFGTISKHYTKVVFADCLSYYLINRESDPTDDLIGGQPESSRQDKHQCLNDGGSNTEVVC